MLLVLFNHISAQIVVLSEQNMDDYNNKFYSLINWYDTKNLNVSDNGHLKTLTNNSTNSANNSIEHYDLFGVVKDYPTRANWNYYIPIFNSNIKDDIYWGLEITLYHNGNYDKYQIWINKKFGEYPNDRDFFYMNSITNSWKKETYYPRSDESEISIISRNFEYKFNQSSQVNVSTEINLNGTTLLYLPYYTDKIHSISILVGSQAILNIGKPYYIYPKFGREENYPIVKNFIENERYFSAMNALWEYNPKLPTLEMSETGALLLAYTQIGLEKYSDCINTTNAIIKFAGDFKKQATMIRGIANENLGDFESALSDYYSSGDMDSYNRLRSKSKPQLKKSTINKTYNKPLLKK